VVFLARALLDTGAAYERDGSVLFRGAQVPERAGLSRAEAEAALEATDHPILGDDPLDVPVWLASSGDDPAWDSPWGPGRPGWHAECAAMATAILGLSVDVHGGGSDLAFPHHAYEAALVEAATGVAPFARAWMHIGEVGVGGEKMAKSTGNLVLIFDLLQEWQAEVVRLMILDRSWGDAWSYEPALLDQAASRLDDLRSAAGRGGGDEAATAETLGRLFDGLDVPGALAVAEESGGEAAGLCLNLLGLT
jgi:cysteinyl-tRNA synthetase